MSEIIHYKNYLTPYARRLRKRMTKAEQVLWANIRRCQVIGVQFRRQRPIGPYIVDFYAKEHKLVIEVDGSIHYSREAMLKDRERHLALVGMGVRILRFTNEQVMFETNKVILDIRAALLLICE